MSNIGYKVIVSGIVQGVGFRYFTFKQAQKLGLKGQVKNLANGKVEVLLFGETSKVDNMLTWLSKGPSNATVDDLQITATEYLNTNSFSCL